MIDYKTIKPDKDELLARLPVKEAMDEYAKIIALKCYAFATGKKWKRGELFYDVFMKFFKDVAI